MSWQPEPEGPQTEVTLGKAQEPLDLGLLYCIIQGQDGMTSKDFPPVVKGSEGPRVGSPGGSWRGAWCEVCVRGGGGWGGQSSWHCVGRKELVAVAQALPQSLRKKPRMSLNLTW